MKRRGILRPSVRAVFLIREEFEISQKDLAETLGIKQPSLSAIENRGNDLKISTMKKYVEAMSGKLRIDVELPTGKHIGFNLNYTFQYA